MLDPESGRKLTLVSAPAGFGKTTLLSKWFESQVAFPGGGAVPTGGGKDSARSGRVGYIGRSAMGLQRWFYRGSRPNRTARVLDRATAAVYARGVSPNYLVTLEVLDAERESP